MGVLLGDHCCNTTTWGGRPLEKKMKRFGSWFLPFILTTLVFGVNSQMKSTKMIPDCKGKEGKITKKEEWTCHDSGKFECSRTIEDCSEGKAKGTGSSAKANYDPASPAMSMSDIPKDWHCRNMCKEGEGCSSGSQEHITEKKECDKVEKGAKKEDSPSKYENEKDGEGEAKEDGKTKEDKGKPTGDGGTEDKAGTKDADEKKDTKAKAETTDKDENASNKTTTTTAKPKKDY